MGEDPAGGHDDDLRELRFERLEMERMYQEAVDEGDRAKRTLDEVILEFLFRGDVIRVMVAERAWTGTVTHVGSELMTLETPAGTAVDIGYDGITALRVVERSPSGGRALAGQHPGAVVARLREVVVTGESVEVGGPTLRPQLEGIVVAVAESHVEFRTRDGGEWIVPLPSIQYVVRQPADHRA